MSLGNQGIFQLLKEVSFRGILAFYNYRKWDHIPKDDRQSLYLTAMFHKQEKQRNHCNTSRNIDIGMPSRAFPVTPPGINRHRYALAGFPCHTTGHTGPYHGGSAG